MKKRMLAILLIAVTLFSLTAFAATPSATIGSQLIYNYAVGTDITNVTKLSTKNITMGTITSGDTTSQGKAYKTNSAVITNNELIEAAKDGKTNIVIYAEPEMAIGFEAGTVWGSDKNADDFARPTSTDNEIWFWSWDGNINYAIVKAGTAGKQATFPITAVSGSTEVIVNVTLCSVAKSTPTLLQTVLPSGYSIKNVPVTLYNYDGKAWNENYEKNGGPYFAFSGSSKGVDSTENAHNRGWTSSGVQANGGGGVALMGIVKDTLVNGLPVMSQGQQVDLFSANAFSGKTVYENVNFQFVYNEATGYYSYNSALNHAQYNGTNSTLELYDQSLAISDTPTGESHGNAGFYPFEDINKAFTNTEYTELTWEEWADKLERKAFELIPSEYATDIAPSNTITPASTADMHYGIQVKSDFYLPSGKKLNGQEMIYEFTGDDDLWVFIDGKLVLDIGGGHTYVSGSFNLTTGEVWVEKYTKLAAADGGSYATREQGTDLKYTDTFLTGLADDQMHTIQIFYLERHGGVSNCRMRFNLPLVPSNSVNVSKNVKTESGEDEFAVNPDEEYTFALYTAADNDDNVDATNFSVLKGAAYTVTGNGAPSETQYTNAETGYFELKEGWIASFSNIARFTEVYAVEIKPNDGYIYTKSEVSVNKAEPVTYTYDEKTETKVMQLNGSINFDFVNYIQTYDLTVAKELEDIRDAEPEDTKYRISVTINEAAYNGEGFENGVIELEAGKSVTIENIPANMTYNVTEGDLPEAPAGYKYEAPVYSIGEETVEEATGKLIADTTVTVTNELIDLIGDLTITKSGIDDLDYHDKEGSQYEAEYQSTIYVIEGHSKANPDETIRMEVVIHGNGSVTIKDLPVGTYTVTEKTDWAWRYTCAAPVVEVTIDGETKTVEFVNTRNQPLWLGGDHFLGNLFAAFAEETTAKPEAPTE